MRNDTISFQYKGQVDLKDSNGRNAYFYSKIYGQDSTAEFLVKNGCTRQQIPQSTNAQTQNMSHNISYVSNTVAASSVPGSVTNRPLNDSNFACNTMSKKNLFSSSPKQPPSAQTMSTTSSR